jgi:ParB-like nuclease family protein
MKKIRVSKSLQSLLPVLSDQELQLLKESIREHGQREPIIVWKQTGLVIDGHNRLEILTKLKRKPRAQSISLPNQQAAESWIRRTQLGRRNLHPNYFAYHWGKEFNNGCQGRGGDRKSNHQSDGLIGSTSKKLSEQSGRSTATIERDAEFADGVDKLEAAMPGMRQRILNGLTPVSKAIIGKLGGDDTATVEKIKSIAAKAKREPTKLEKEVDALYGKKDPFRDIYPFIGVLEWADKSKASPTPLSRIREYFEKDVSGRYHKKNKTIDAAIALLRSYKGKL